MVEVACSSLGAVHCPISGLRGKPELYESRAAELVVVAGVLVLWHPTVPPNQLELRIPLLPVSVERDRWKVVNFPETFDALCLQPSREQSCVCVATRIVVSLAIHPWTFSPECVELNAGVCSSI